MARETKAAPAREPGSGQMAGRWNGSVVVCIASGPSVTKEDCDLVRRWRDESHGRRVIVVNTTFRAAPWADLLYAMDAKWWTVNAAEVANAFEGERSSTTNVSALPVTVIGKTLAATFGNSGAAAVSIARHAGARRVLLLGYDCQRTGGKVHWHGDHPKGMGNAGGLPRWPAQFAQAARDLTNVEIVNCSRETALTCWPRGNLEDWLWKD